MKTKVLGESIVRLMGNGDRWTVGTDLWNTRAMTKVQAEEIFDSITTAKQLRAIISDAYDCASAIES